MRPARLLLHLLLFTTTSNVQAQLHSTENIDSLAAAFTTELARQTSPALENRRRIRTHMQRSGYTATLIHLLEQDGLMAACTFIRTKLHIEYALSHRPLFIFVVVNRGEGRTVALPLHDTWAFPVNPWEK